MAAAGDQVGMTLAVSVVNGNRPATQANTAVTPPR